jgi:hypothetical protein
MSDEKSFFARWSRRKHAADVPTVVQSNQEKCNDVLVSELPTASLAQPPAFDVAGLPSAHSSKSACRPT